MLWNESKAQHVSYNEILTFLITRREDQVHSSSLYTGEIHRRQKAETVFCCFCSLPVLDGLECVSQASEMSLF